MKFYDCQTAPSPRRVRMFIAEKGLEIETIQIDLRERQQLEPEFLKINPFATVPVLELDDGTRLLSTAGCRSFLEREYPQPALLGDTPKQAGLVSDLLWRIESDAFSAVGECLRNSAKGMKGRAVTGSENYDQIPELAERGRQRATRFFAVLDDVIADQPFVAGDTFTAADIDAFIFVEFAKWIKLATPEDCGNIKRWHQMMSERDSASL